MQTGRVIEVQRIYTTVMTENNQMLLATVRGDFHTTGEYPKVGDYVEVSQVDASEEAQAVIERVLPRTSVISRLNQETLQPQVLVANVDLIIVVMGLDDDFNPNRLERYLALAQQSDIAPIIVLNKADVTDQLVEQRAVITELAGTTPVYVTTAQNGDGLAQLLPHITPTTTAVLLGSSGAGKSTITNWLLGRVEQSVQTVRADDSKGRHTTTTRQLFSLPTGGYLIDTPGMRELSLVDNDALAEEQQLNQIETLASQCRFNNCDHYKSDGCAVQTAIEQGELSERALENYHKLAREQAWLRDKSGGKERYINQRQKRQSQAYAAAKKRRLMRGG